MPGGALDLPIASERRLTLSVEDSMLVFRYPVWHSGAYPLEWAPDLATPAWQVLTNPLASPGILTLRIEPPSAPAFCRIREP